MRTYNPVKFNKIYPKAGNGITNIYLSKEQLADLISTSIEILAKMDQDEKVVLFVRNQDQKQIFLVKENR